MVNDLGPDDDEPGESGEPGEPGTARRLPDAPEGASTPDAESAVRPTPSWVLIVAGVVLIGAAAWAAATGWVGLAGSHPIGWVTTLVAALVGGGFVVRALTARRGRHLSGWRFWALRSGAILVTVVLALIVVYTRPFSAEQVAIDAVGDGAGVDVTDGSTAILMEPVDPHGTGLVFYPGAKVDPRAYARVLRPLAEAGFPVVIVKQPYNLAILGIGAAGRWVGDPDDVVDRWVVGGHSLGGAMAASYVSEERPELVGLLLYAAFPPGDLSDRDLAVTSVSGTRDGLATPQKIADSAADLPPDTEFVAIEGANHAVFGDYGPQGGDGEATVDRETAQRQIAAATLAFLERIDADR